MSYTGLHTIINNIYFYQGKYTGYWYLSSSNYSRAVQTIEYFYNGTPPITWECP